MEQHYGFFRSVLLMIAIGIWVIVLQNAGVFPQLNPSKVRVIDLVEVKGTVDIENTVFIKGKVDANLESINGYSKFYKDPRTGEYYVIPVTDTYE
jgi:hypothetical protein